MVKENERNIELIWLTEDVKPEYRTIIDYRREKKEAIKKMVVEFRLFLKQFRYITGEQVVYDGSKIKGDAGKQIYSIEKIDKKLKNIKEDNEKYMKEWEKIDELEDDLESKTNQISELMKRVEELNKKTEKYEDLKKKVQIVANQIQITERSKRESILVCLNEPDTRMMKGRDGYKMGYNAQIGVDSKHKFIVFNEIINETNDTGSLERNVKTQIKETGIRPQKVVADKGYNVINQIKNLERKGIDCYIPQHTESENKVKYNYNEEKNIIICSGNKIFTTTNKIKLDRHQKYKLFRTTDYSDCKDCKNFDKCIRNKKGIVTVHLNLDYKFINYFKTKMKTLKAIQLIDERKEIVEHVFANLKSLIGRLGFTIKGIRNVQTAFDIFEISYNIKHLCNLNIFDKSVLLQQLEIYFDSKKSEIVSHF
jgi:uncharacterized protein (UPF0297 family)